MLKTIITLLIVVASLLRGGKTGGGQYHTVDGRNVQRNHMRPILSVWELYLDGFQISPPPSLLKRGTPPFGTGRRGGISKPEATLL